MKDQYIEACGKKVALLAEGVGRNMEALADAIKYGYVALLAEGVGRNCKRPGRQRLGLVALLAEGVGRNGGGRRCAGVRHRRPPRGGRG